MEGGGSIKGIGDGGHTGFIHGKLTLLHVDSGVPLRCRLPGSQLGDGGAYNRGVLLEALDGEPDGGMVMANHQTERVVASLALVISSRLFLDCRVALIPGFGRVEWRDVVQPHRLERDGGGWVS